MGGHWSGGARKRAIRPDCNRNKAISLPALAFLLSAILSSTGCIGVTGASKAQSTSGTAAISVAPAAIKFGSVAIGSTASQSVTVSNTGSSNLTVTQASTTAGGITITGVSLPLSIDAGKQSTFNVVFTPKSAGVLSGNVFVISDVSSTPSAVSLSGIGMAATADLIPSTSSLNFGSVVVGKSSVFSVVLANAGNSNVTVSAVSVTGASYSTSGVSAGLVLAPGQSATLDVTFTPAATGSLPGSITVSSNATNSPLKISLSGGGPLSAAHSVALTWTASSSSVAGYNVYRSQVSGGPYAKLDSSIVSSNSYTDLSVQAGLTYYYVLTSVSSGGMESSKSSQVSVTVP
jgi:HYDIN/CFA65/VesB family protein/ASPM-SPD-2-Hydin domain-containing protein